MMPEDFISNNRLDMEGVFRSFCAHPAIVHVGKKPAIQTFGDVARCLIRLSVFFKSKGILPKSRVAVYKENSPLHFLLFLLAWVEDYMFVPLNFQTPLEMIVNEVPFDVVIVPFGADPGPREGGPLFIPVEALLGCMESKDMPDINIPFIDLDQECSLIFTSGSTGRPKGVVHTVGNHVYSASGVITFLGLARGDRWLVSLPLNHVGGLSILTRMFLSGGTAVFPESRYALDKGISGGSAGFISVVPTQLIRFMKSEPMTKILSSMRGILLGGSSVPGWVIDKARDLSLPIIPSYGSTESCSLVTAVPKGSDAAAYSTSGKPLPHRKIKADADGRIQIGGKTLFAFYLENEKKLFPFDSGWFTTSDLGYTDDQGNWIITGRADDIFISGGENINPCEIEKYLMQIEGIESAVVVPVPHPEFGSVGWAFVLSSKIIDTADIFSILRMALPSFKIPKKIFFMDPVAPSGIKTDRAFLKQKALEMAGESHDRMS